MSPEPAHYLVENPNLAGFAIKPKKPLPGRKRLFGFERPTGLVLFYFLEERWSGVGAIVTEPGGEVRGRMKGQTV